ncbi:helix-turn-helix domain-containing protein [Tomitella cavernea]|uniref:GAF domain-containing protein n=1 Tax=Tomitella cavernea TaxID=1387982 RepID=A0ABP9CHF6_9ACTN
MGGFSAVQPGTDLPRYAHRLARVHDAVLSGAAPSDAPRAVVARSWSRMLAVGRTADSAAHRLLADPSELERRRGASALRYVIGELRLVIEAIADASHMLLVVADADGVILWRSGSAAVRRHADRLGFTEGAEWTEQRVGTNAIGTALTEAAPVQLFSAEHFEQSQHPWYCTASPIHDPRTGRLLGVVDVSGPAMTLHPTVVALVETAVRLAESQLWRHHEQRLEQLRSSAAAALAGRSGPALLVDTEGWVAQSDGVGISGRVPVPHPDKPMQVPGMGMCRAEEVAGGWLIRPTGSSSRIALTLTLTAEPIVSGGGRADAGAAVLTARHAEILLLLYARRPDGMSAAQLSRDLFGDAEHIVTVRAEVSRLRRVLGGIVLSRPYRLADSVELTLDPAGAGRAAESPFVQRVACPGVRGTLAGSRY